jgi:hypothetical protein
MARFLQRWQSPIVKVDELRRGIEDLGEDYNHLSYNECWTVSIANILIQKGVISVEELGRKMHEVATRWQKERAQ